MDKEELSSIKQKTQGAEFLIKIALIWRQLHFELVKHGTDSVFLIVHNRVEDLEDGVEDKLVKSTLEGLAVRIHHFRRPFFGRGIEEIVAPQLRPTELVYLKAKMEKKSLHRHLLVHAELLGVAAGKLTEGEAPAVLMWVKNWVRITSLRDPPIHCQRQRYPCRGIPGRRQGRHRGTC